MITYFLKFFNELIWITMEMAPYLMLGFIIAGLLHVYFPKDKITRYLGKNNIRSVINAALLGIPLPLCSCGVIPTGISFYKSGASQSATVSFLIATPQTGVDSIMVTYSMLGGPMALLRPIIALFTAILGGMATRFFYRKNETVLSVPEAVITDTPTDKNKLYVMARYAFVEFMQDLSKWLIIGILLAALIAVLIPNDFFTNYLTNSYLSMLVVLVASVPMYICATGSVPIAMVLMMKGLSPGAAIVLLMAGPATNAATMTVIRKVMGAKVFWAYLMSIVAGALFFGTLVNEFLPAHWFAISKEAGLHAGHDHHDIIPYWLKLASTIILIGLLINGYVQKYLAKRKNRKQSEALITNLNITSEMKLIKVSVTGMTCNHCKATVEKNVKTLNGVVSVVANPEDNTVIIEGENVEVQSLSDLINGLGYEYKGEVK